MSGTITTINGATVVSQFTAIAGSPSSTQALAALGSVTFTTFDTNGGSIAGAGQYLTIGPSVTTATINGATAVVSTVAGVNLTVSGNTQVFALGNNDTVTATGADTLFAGTGFDSFMSTGDNSSIVGGSGPIAATASGANTTLIGGTGVSNFTVSGAGSVAVEGYSGQTTIALTDTGGAEIATNPLAGASGTLVATLSATGADTVIGGGGNSTITAGGGADVFGFVNGHAGGFETISGFNSKDNFAFGGYESLGGAIKTEAVATTIDPAAGGSDVITLTDGTVITLYGYDKTVF